MKLISYYFIKLRSIFKRFKDKIILFGAFLLQGILPYFCKIKGLRRYQRQITPVKL